MQIRTKEAYNKNHSMIIKNVGSHPTKLPAQGLARTRADPEVARSAKRSEAIGIILNITSRILNACMHIINAHRATDK